MSGMPTAGDIVNLGALSVLTGDLKVEAARTGYRCGLAHGCFVAE